MTYCTYVLHTEMKLLSVYIWLCSPLLHTYSILLLTLGQICKNFFVTYSSLFGCLKDQCQASFPQYLLAFLSSEESAACSCSNSYCPYENQTVHLKTVNHIVCAWTITSIKSCYLPGFLKLGYGKKSWKTIRFDPYWPLTEISSVFKRYYSLTHMFSQGFFVNFYQKLVFYFCSKHLLKKLNQGQYGLTTVLLEKFDQLLWKTYIYIWLVVVFFQYFE